MNNQFNVGDMIKSTTGNEIYAIVSDVVPSALMYRVIYLYNGEPSNTLSFKYAHRFYDVVSERA